MSVANYSALAAHLQHMGTLTLRMTFSEVEAITGKLPPSARSVRQWWENDPEKAQAREGWLAAGYETSSVSIKDQTLEFVARGNITSRPSPGSP